MSKPGITIIGDKEVKQILSQLPDKVGARIMRDIARKGGRVIVKTARQMVQVPGTLGKHFKSDIGVASDRGNKAGVIVRLNMGKVRVNSQGKAYKPSVAARHVTEGTKQQVRVTSGKKLYRGKVAKRYPDPILQAGQRSGGEALKVMQTETKTIIEKHIKKLAKR